MDKHTKEDLREALAAITSMIRKTENAKGKFPEGTSQHSLQTNRLNMLIIASSFISSELADSIGAVVFPKDNLERALAPLASLLRKSEKAQAKLAPGSWQHTMLGNNLKALRIASSLLTEALRETAV